MSTKSNRNRTPHPPALDQLPLIQADAEIARWLDHYWAKLKLPLAEQGRLAITTQRSQFHLWTGRRLNPLALGCYCYLPNVDTDDADLMAEQGISSAMQVAPAEAPSRVQPALPGFASALATTDDDGQDEYDDMILPLEQDYRHLIFVEPDLLPLGIEVTVAHELIHLSDRVQGNPRKHRCHGYDSISVDEAAITGRDPELLRVLLREETTRREAALRAIRPYRYLYVCPHCAKEYPRVRRYARPVSCGRCDHQYNPAFLLQLNETAILRQTQQGDEGQTATA